jgi:hypothetical protein
MSWATNLVHDEGHDRNDEKRGEQQADQLERDPNDEPNDQGRRYYEKNAIDKEFHRTESAAC